MPSIPINIAPLLASAVSTDVDLKLGTLVVTTHNCDGTPATGVSYQVRNGGTKTLVSYFAGGVISAGATNTDESGQGAIANVEPGFVTVEAFNAEGGFIGEVGLIAASR